MGFAYPENIERYIASDGRKVPCTFKEHPYFGIEGNISAALLFIFAHIVATRVHTQGYLLNRVTNAFLTYLADYNTNMPTPLKVLNISDISAEIFNGFVHFCQRTNCPANFGPTLKACIKVVAEETGKIPLLHLPMVSGQRGAPTEPLYDDGFESLSKALITHTDNLYAMLKAREAIEKVTAYTYEEIAKKAFCEISKDDFVHWWRTTSFSDAIRRKEEVKRRLKRCADPELRSLFGAPQFMKKAGAIAEDHYLPENFVSDEIVDNLPAFYDWYPDDFRVIKTFVAHGFPMKISIDDLEGISGQGCMLLEDCDTVVKLLLNRIRWSVGKNREGVLWPLDWYIGDYYPQSIDMAALILFIMLQSGWNQETVMSLDKDSFEHPLTGAISAAHTIVYGEKNRSQGHGKGYSDPEPIFAPSNADDPYSLVSLVRLAKELSLPLHDLPYDFVSELTTEEKLNDLFLFLRESNDWFRAGRHSSQSYGKYFRQGVMQFLKEYTITDNGKHITTVKDITLRLRPTWVKYKKKENDLGFISQRLHHKSRSTTDIFYDSSAQAEQKRKLHLRSEQEEVMTLIRARNFAGLKVSKKVRETEKGSNIRIFAIPGIERPMWGCDGREPTWPGARLTVVPGEKCYALENCWFCKSQMVFQDSLPFMIERLAHIDDFLDGDNEPSFRNRIASERAAIMEVLDDWNDDEAMREAVRHQRKNGPLLPSDLTLLKLIFKTGDL